MTFPRPSAFSSSICHWEPPPPDPNMTPLTLISSLHRKLIHMFLLIVERRCNTDGARLSVDLERLRILEAEVKRNPVRHSRTGTTVWVGCRYLKQKDMR